MLFNELSCLHLTNWKHGMDQKITANDQEMIEPNKIPKLGNAHIATMA